MKLTARLVLIHLALSTTCAPALAKGLDALSEKSPEAEPKDGQPSAKEGEDAVFKEDEDGAQDKGETKEDEGGVPAKAPVNALTQKLYFATSYGRVKASRKGGGSWRSSGMSDFAVGYRLLPTKSPFIWAVTYRYAPVAVSAQVNSQSYRGTWETHYAGVRVDTKLGASLRAVASIEGGYLRAALRSTDGLPGEHSAARSGAVGAFGLGADYLMLDGGVLAVGPRFYGAYGVATTSQTALSVGLSF